MKYGLSNTTLEEILAVFRENSHVEEVILFGSRAKGTYRPGSDIDLAVKGKDLTFQEFIKLLVKLDELEILYKIDAINYQTIKSQELLDHISRVGVSLLQTAAP
ncbi:nucleotidyltransferase family protein [Salmonirosea aquatica]|uniref:Nucleotidyltransferase domain-containing protein n=1 Tax=Salmonirosea aquatica TaxID=2654236 RepID=A0A7C9F829_9BACT|nr:nucleotidyltransferase domain-containing protein [Cytophagaceae bacterium SJW1-29]